MAAEAEMVQAPLAEGRRLPTLYDGKYWKLESDFPANMQTWKMFPPVRRPEKMSLADLRRFEENQVVNRVAKAVAESKSGAIKVSFKKAIKFKREKAERGPNGEIQYEKIKHFFQPRQHLVTKETTKKEIRDLYRKDMDEIQEEIEQWI